MVFDPSAHTFHSPDFQGVLDDAIRFFRTTPVQSLPPRERFAGSGVYALYYVGDNQLYAPLAKLNRPDCRRPIYVGKAVPPGWRTARVDVSETPDLCRRLREHTRSIRQIRWSPGDFRCRFTILTGREGNLIVPLEAELIRLYRPLWNTVVDGFGNHDPGSGRYNQARAEWDVLHPGRTWARRLTGESPDLEEVQGKVRNSLRSLRLS